MRNVQWLRLAYDFLFFEVRSRNTCTKATCVVGEFCGLGIQGLSFHRRKWVGVANLFSPKKRQKKAESASSGTGKQVILAICPYAAKRDYVIPGAEPGPLFVIDLKYDQRPSPLYKAESSLETFLEGNKRPTFRKSIAALVRWPGESVGVKRYRV